MTFDLLQLLYIIRSCFSPPFGVGFILLCHNGSVISSGQFDLLSDLVVLVTSHNVLSYT